MARIKVGLNLLKHRSIREKMKFRYTLPVFLALAFIFLFAGNSYACSCLMSDAPVKTQVKTAKTGAVSVFSGEVLEITPSVDQMSVTVRIKVESIWKGARSSEKVITTARDSAACGFTFTVGQKYLIYTHGGVQSESVSNCSRTSQLSGAKKDIAYLGKKLKK